MFTQGDEWVAAWPSLRIIEILSFMSNRTFSVWYKYFENVLHEFKLFITKTWLSKVWPVRKHLTRGFLYAVLELSGTLWPLLILEYSGIKRRGTPFPGACISHYGDKYPLPFYEPYGKRWLFATLFDRDRLMFCKSGILIFVFAENDHLVRQSICPRHVD